MTFMRLAGALVTLALSASSSFADRPPFEVVRVLPETSQVLVYDRADDTHVLLAPGSMLHDYTLVELSGIGMIVERGAERITMYPKGAQDIALDLTPNHPVPSPAVFGKLPFAPGSGTVAARGGGDRPRVAAASEAEAPRARVSVAERTPRPRASGVVALPMRSALLKP